MTILGALLAIFVASAAAAWTETTPGSSGGGAFALTEATFAAAVADPTYKAVFVKLYAPWCGHCKKLAPLWDELAAADGALAAAGVRVAKVDCTAEKAVCAALSVRGYPTVVLVHTESGLVYAYKSTRTAEAFIDFATKIARGEAGTRESAPLPPSLRFQHPPPPAEAAAAADVVVDNPEQYVHQTVPSSNEEL